MNHYGLDGFYNWDVVAAAYLLDKDLLENNETDISPDMESLKSGFLTGGGEHAKVDLPKIKDKHQFEERVYQNYLKVKVKV